MKKILTLPLLLVAVIIINIAWTLFWDGIFLHDMPYYFVHIKSFSPPTYNQFLGSLVGAWIEELLFRALPLLTAVLLEKFFPGKILVPAMIMSSIAFGYMHGSVMNILFQGFRGLMYAIEFVYVGKTIDYGTALTQTTVTHAVYNTIMHGLQL